MGWIEQILAGKLNKDQAEHDAKLQRQQKQWALEQDVLGREQQQQTEGMLRGKAAAMPKLAETMQGIAKMAHDNMLKTAEGDVNRLQLLGLRRHYVEAVEYANAANYNATMKINVLPMTGSVEAFERTLQGIVAEEFNKVTGLQRQLVPITAAAESLVDNIPILMQSDPELQNLVHSLGKYVGAPAPIAVGNPEDYVEVGKSAAQTYRHGAQNVLDATKGFLKESAPELGAMLGAGRIPGRQYEGGVKPTPEARGDRYSSGVAASALRPGETISPFARKAEQVPEATPAAAKSPPPEANDLAMLGQLARRTNKVWQSPGFAAVLDAYVAQDKEGMAKAIDALGPDGQYILRNVVSAEADRHSVRAKLDPIMVRWAEQAATLGTNLDGSKVSPEQLKAAQEAIKLINQGLSPEQDRAARATHARMADFLRGVQLTATVPTNQGARVKAAESARAEMLSNAGGLVAGNTAGFGARSYSIANSAAENAADALLHLGALTNGDMIKSAMHQFDRLSDTMGTRFRDLVLDAFTHKVLTHVNVLRTADPDLYQKYVDAGYSAETLQKMADGAASVIGPVPGRVQRNIQNITDAVQETQRSRSILTSPTAFNRAAVGPEGLRNVELRTTEPPTVMGMPLAAPEKYVAAGSTLREDAGPEAASLGWSTRTMMSATAQAADQYNTEVSALYKASRPAPTTQPTAAPAAPAAEPAITVAGYTPSGGDYAPAAASAESAAATKSAQLNKLLDSDIAADMLKADGVSEGLINTVLGQVFGQPRDLVLDTGGVSGDGGTPDAAAWVRAEWDKASAERKAAEAETGGGLLGLGGAKTATPVQPAPALPQLPSPELSRPMPQAPTGPAGSIAPGALPQGQNPGITRQPDSPGLSQVPQMGMAQKLFG